MSETVFFLGERVVDEFEVFFHNGKARLSCTIVERWEEEISRSIRCGAELKRTLTQREGITSIDREDLEANVTGSLGLKGLAEFKSEIRGKTGRELRLEVTQERSETFTIRAPDCGRFTALTYQLQRVYQLCYQDKRLWHRDSWTKTITEWTKRVHDASSRAKHDPACDCKEEEMRDVDTQGTQGTLYLALGHISMLVGYESRADSVYFPDLNASATTAEVESYLSKTLTVKREGIRPHVLFLAGEDQDSLTGRLRPYVEEWSTELGRAEPAEKPARTIPRSYLKTKSGMVIEKGAGEITVRIPLEVLEDKPRENVEPGYDPEKPKIKV
jgi:hypothetical protein